KVAVAVAALASFAMRAVPTGIDPGWITLAAGIGAAALAAILFPKEPEQGNAEHDAHDRCGLSALHTAVSTFGIIRCRTRASHDRDR
ncbi:MAG: hypothetical protein J6O90_05845, partial [Candidatus Methanomethylophilaceae archaeon]|nr:hypothetical protein [Candidatus Methanomethylophilaceae archaeon]